MSHATTAALSACAADSLNIGCRRRWLMEHQCPVELLTALQHLPLDSLDEVIDELDVVEVDERACALAAFRGRLDLLTWLRERSWPWDESCCMAAMRSGELDCLRWALKNGCPDHGVCMQAVETGNLQALQALLQLGYRCEEAELQRAVTLLAGDAAFGRITELLAAEGYTLPEAVETPQSPDKQEDPRDFYSDPADVASPHDREDPRDFYSDPADQENSGDDAGTRSPGPFGCDAPFGQGRKRVHWDSAQAAEHVEDGLPVDPVDV